MRGPRGRLPELMLATAAVATVLVALGGAEAALRLADPRYLDRTRGPYVYSAELGWKLRPGFRGYLHDTWTTVNARGYRGVPHPPEKAPGRVRVVMLGDSIAFGHRVSDEQTFGALLEARSGRYEVVNLAVEGYGTDQELIQLRSAAEAWRPDVVVLNFCVHNDVLNNSLVWDDQDGTTPKPWFSLEGETLRRHDEHLRLSATGRLAQWLADESHVYTRLGGTRTAARRPAPPGGRLFDTPTATRLTVRLIHEVAGESRRHGARFLLVLHPDEPALRGQKRLPRRLRAEPLLAAVPLLDLGERYRARGMKLDELLFDYQGHLRPRGHVVAVQEIEQALLDLEGDAPHSMARMVASSASSFGS